MALSRAWISHLPNNYANDPKSDFGKLRMDRMFENAAGPMTPGGTNGAGRPVHKKRWSDIDRYMVLPNKVIEGIRWRLGLRR
jgi:hypothetical protein